MDQTKAIIASYILVPAGSSIIANRAREANAGQIWDRRLLGAIFLVNVVTFLVAGLDSGRLVSSTVRIQMERGHRVCASGLYRHVRHPGYLGMLMSILAFPLVLNSYWTFLPAVIAAVLLAARTVLEDRFLTRELRGYSDYAVHTRWRLVPGIF